MTQKRSYTRISPEMVPVMDELQGHYGLTYDEVARLFRCSRSRVIQLVTKHRGENGHSDTGPGSPES